jgi:predicted methyltransferase
MRSLTTLTTLLPLAALCLLHAAACTPAPRAATPSSTPPAPAAPAALADTTYPDGKSAIEAAIKGTHRLPANVARDRYRHPAETLAFFGFEPTMTVLDVDPGEGWYTELLAPALAKQGKYIATATRILRNSPDSRWSPTFSDAFAAFLARSPAVYGKVQRVFVDYQAPHLDLDGQVDLVLMMREAHMMRGWGTLDAWLREAFRALKPAGILGIVDHRAPEVAPAEGRTAAGYVQESWVIAQAEAAGFKLVGKSEINANPGDTKDYAHGVWALPPEFYDGVTRREGASAASGDADIQRYAAIGESDRMTLKFVKLPRASP